MRHRLLAIATLFAVLTASRLAAAQSCDRNCPAAQRDARGCCPKKPQPPPPRPQPPRPQPPGQPPAPPPPPQVFCPPGQETSDETAGHCCWPGQVWSKSRTACIGTPTRCPPGFAMKGETCDGSDRDHDGMLDANDPCVESAEDFDGYRDDDGCPDDDNDGDGIADGTDQCRDSAEDVNGNQDDDGCPEGIAPPPAPPPPDLGGGFVPPPQPSASYGTERLSTSAMVCGIVVTSLALLNTVVGAAAIGISAGGGGDFDFGGGDPPIFLLNIIGSAAMFSIGIPLWAVGAAQTERTEPETSVRVGPGSLRIDF